MISVGLRYSCKAPQARFALECRKNGEFVEYLLFVEIDLAVGNNHVLQGGSKSRPFVGGELENACDVAGERRSLRPHPMDNLGQLIEHIDRDLLAKSFTTCANHQFIFDELANRIEFLGVKLTVRLGRSHEDRERRPQGVSNFAGYRNRSLGVRWREFVQIHQYMIAKVIRAGNHFSIGFDKAFDTIASELTECAAFMTDGTQNGCIRPARQFQESDPSAGQVARGADVVDCTENLIEGDGAVFVYVKEFTLVTSQEFFLNVGRRRQSIDRGRRFQIRGAAAQPGQKRHRKTFSATINGPEEAAANNPIRATGRCAA